LLPKRRYSEYETPHLGSRTLEKSFVAIIERAWERTFESPSLLRTPRFSVPRIRAACSGPGVGLQKVARILLAARDAVFVKLPPEIQSEIEQLAE
jgi:hypothetical protein